MTETEIRRLYRTKPRSQTRHKRQRLEALARQMRAQYLYTGSGCASRRKAIEQREASHAR